MECFRWSRLEDCDFFFAEPSERGEEGRNELRELQDDDDDPVETQPEWRARLQRLRIVL